MTLRTQLVVLQVLIVLAIVVTAGIAALWMQSEQIRDASQERMIAVARSVAQLPTIIEAYDEARPEETIQPIAELIRDASDVTYIVVTDDEGIRYSHPNPDRIGEMVSTDPSVALSGEMYVGTQTGTLGESWRVKVPIMTDDGTILGQVSVGILESTLDEQFLHDASLFGLTLGIAAIVAVAAAAGVARVVRRRIFELEPDEIRSLLETREATLHGMREGLVALDDRGRVTICNDAAARLLGLASPEHTVGAHGSDLFGADLSALIAARTGETAPQRLILAGERVLLARATPITLRGQDAGTAVILMDRTEIDDALRRLAGAESLADGLRAQQHEFANTLHTIGGLIDLGETDAARRVIDRGSSGGALSSLGAHDGIRDVEVTALLLAKRAQARERGITLHVADGSSLSPTEAQRDDLLTVVGNLVDNALDASRSGGTVTIDILETAGEISVIVDDDGDGIDEADRENVFTIGYSTKAADAPRGYGLTLVSRVIERLRGHIDVGDSPLGGARFAVHLPRHRTTTASGEIAR